MKKSFKFKNDFFYKSTAAVFGEESLKDAGWFDDKIEDLSYEIETPYTPLDKIYNNLKKSDSKKIAVLLSTGSFAPFHKGHLEMFELSKKLLQSKGYFVVGGYFSPSHEDYVLSKYNKSIKMTSQERIQFLRDSVEDTIYSVDPWEAEIAPAPINFTDVYLRLASYLKYHIGLDAEIFYVFGSDNYNFHKAFISNGNCICVQRDGFDPIIDESRDNFFYIKTKNNSISSTKIRKTKKDIPLEKNNLPYLIREDIYLSKYQKDKIKKTF